MDIKEIQDLIKLINKSNIGELNIERGDFKLNIKQKEEKVMTVSAMPQQVVMQAAPAQSQSAPVASSAPAAAPSVSAEKDENLVVVKSPMIGTFYRRPGPDKPIFAEVGDEIGVGKVLCIIEAMKLFNEIESEVAGRIVKILVDDASPVEYDQPLFLVDPS